MTDFAQAPLIRRRQILEEALAQALEAHFDIDRNAEGERCLVAPGWAQDEATLVPLWTIASEIEVHLA